MRAPYLLDTCVLIWMATQSADGLHALSLLDQSDHDGIPVYVSPFSAWELGMLTAKGRLALSVPLRFWFSGLIARSGTKLATLTPDVLIAANDLPWKTHPDPADRIIVATAREYGLNILTRDRKILDYAAKGHVMALAC